MARPEKEAAVQEVAEILEKAKSVFINDFQGLNVEKMGELRQKCREASVGYRVVKNTLARLAVQKVGRDEIVKYLEGPSAIAYSYEDPSAPARVLSEFAKAEDRPTIKASLFEGTFYGPERVKDIAMLPSKEVLLSNIVRGFSAPIQGLACGLSGILSKFVRTLNAVKETQQKAQS
jgi:large subunit ribosomal protein L10